MDLQAHKYHKCAQDGGEAILHVDVETETIPRTDTKGNLMYYCLERCHTFIVEATDGVSERGRREPVAAQ